MGRPRAYQLEKRATLAKARETFMATPRTPPPYKQRGETQKVLYPTLLSEDLYWFVDVRKSSANLLISGSPASTDLAAGGLTSLGLFATLPTGKVSANIKGSGQKPARLAWFHTDDSPATKTTPWGTTSTSFAKKTGAGREEQSHRTCPVGDATGVPTYAGVIAVVTALLTTAKKEALTGTSRGSITFLPELGKIILD